MIAEVDATVRPDVGATLRRHRVTVSPRSKLSRYSERCALASAISTLNMVAYWILDVTLCSHGPVVVPGLLGRIARVRLALGQVPCAEGVIPWV